MVAEAACCRARVKFMFQGLTFLTEAECGISDSEIADFMIFDFVSCQGRPVVTFRFCPWCGKPWKPRGELQKLPGGAP